MPNTKVVGNFIHHEDCYKTEITSGEEHIREGIGECAKWRSTSLTWDPLGFYPTISEEAKMVRNTTHNPNNDRINAVDRDKDNEEGMTSNPYSAEAFTERLFNMRQELIQSRNDYGTQLGTLKGQQEFVSSEIGAIEKMLNAIDQGIDPSTVADENLRAETNRQRGVVVNPAFPGYREGY